MSQTPFRTRIVTAAGIAAAAGALSVGGVLGVAPAGATPAAAAPAAAAPAKADTSFITTNEQGNLAEISVGMLAETRGRDARTRELGRTIISDHKILRTQLTAAAKKIGASVPTSPNALQLSQAAQLKAAAPGAFDKLFAQMQVTAHEQALSATRTERSSTSVAGLRTYANSYIQRATPHLTMAEAELRALGGSATSVPAGSGGLAATNGDGSTLWLWSTGAGALLLLGGTTTAYRRRRVRTTA